MPSFLLLLKFFVRGFQFFAVLSMGFLIACKASKSPELIKQERIQKTLELAEFQSSNGEFQAAIESLEQLIQEYPNEADLLEALALFQSQMGDSLEAAHQFQRLAELLPEEDRYWRYSAHEAMKAQAWGLAIKAYTKYLIYNPEDAMAWRGLGEAERADGASAQALAAYQRALSLEQEADQELSLKACLAISLEREDHILAANYLQMLLQKKGMDDPDAQVASFDFYYLIQDKLKAWHALEQVYKNQAEALKDPTRSVRAKIIQDWKTKLDAQIEEEQKARELERLEELKRLEAEKEAERVLAEKAAEAEQARIEAEKSLLAPPQPSAEDYAQKANQKMDLGDFKEAISLYWKALALEENSPAKWQALSQAALKNEDLETAELAALEAVRRDNENLLYTLNLLDIMQKSASTDRFLAELVRAKEHFPQSIELTYDLARAYDTLARNKRNARIMYEEYLNMAPLDHPHRIEAEQALRSM